MMTTLDGREMIQAFESDRRNRSINLFEESHRPKGGHRLCTKNGSLDFLIDKESLQHVLELIRRNFLGSIGTQQRPPVRAAS